MALIDTNILVYAANTECREHEKAARALKEITEGTEVWHLTWQNIFEFVRTVTDERMFRTKPFYIDEAIERIRDLMASPSLQMIHPGPRHFEFFMEVASRTPTIRGAFVHDARLVAIMLENGVRKIHTNDEGFLRFREIQVVNPLA